MHLFKKWLHTTLWKKKLFEEWQDYLGIIKNYEMLSALLLRRCICLLQKKSLVACISAYVQM
jgi:hypothetical protein